MVGARRATKNHPAIAPMMQIKKTIVLSATKPASKRSQAETIDPRMSPTVMTDRSVKSHQITPRDGFQNQLATRVAAK